MKKKEFNPEILIDNVFSMLITLYKKYAILY